VDTEVKPSMVNHVYYGDIVARRKKKPSKIIYKTCQACEYKSEYFVTISLNGDVTKYYIICLQCYDGDKWRTKIKTKEPIMSGGS